jgi:hypothetical protein
MVLLCRCVVSCCRVGWEDPGPCPALCRAAPSSAPGRAPRRLGGPRVLSGPVSSSAEQRAGSRSASAGMTPGPVRLPGTHCVDAPAVRCARHTVRVGWEDPWPCPAPWHTLRRCTGSALREAHCQRQLGGSWALLASVPSSAPDAPDWWSGPRVGTSESGAQPPVGRTKNISHVLCFDVVSGVTSEETRLANFYFRTFFGDLGRTRPPLAATATAATAATAPTAATAAAACPRRTRTRTRARTRARTHQTPLYSRLSHTAHAVHDARSASVHAACCPPSHHRRSHHSAPGTRILGPARLCADRCVQLVSRRTARVGWEDPGPCPPLCRAARPVRRIGDRPEGGHLRIWRAAPGRAH